MGESGGMARTRSDSPMYRDIIRVTGSEVMIAPSWYAPNTLSVSGTENMSAESDAAADADREGGIGI